MTIRPPAKVNVNEIINRNHILASGVDSVNLAVYVYWEHIEIFDYFESLKLKAREINDSCPGEITYQGGLVKWPFDMKPHGTDGYSWLIIGNDYSLKVGNWLDATNRPNMMVEIHSETLWRLGVQQALSRIIGIIESIKATVIEVLLSRVDLCVDVLLPNTIWSIDLIDYAVTRATDTAPYYKHRQLTGIRIGKGYISARLYDKPLEIAQQSKKIWMYDIWGLESVQEGFKVIRIEYQLRRQFLKEIKLNTPEDLYSKDAEAWAHCTENWLKFQSNPGAHHTQRKTLPFWSVIQKGYRKAQDACPVVREKAYIKDARQAVLQVNGHLSSLMAIEIDKKGGDESAAVTFEGALSAYIDELGKHEIDINADLQRRVKKKKARYHRISGQNTTIGGNHHE